MNLVVPISHSTDGLDNYDFINYLDVQDGNQYLVTFYAGKELVFGRGWVNYLDPTQPRGLTYSKSVVVTVTGGYHTVSVNLKSMGNSSILNSEKIIAVYYPVDITAIYNMNVA